MTQAELYGKFSRIVFGEAGNESNAILTAPELHKIMDETWTMLLAELGKAPCDHPNDQRWKHGAVPNMHERCGLCGRAVE